MTLSAAVARYIDEHQDEIVSFCSSLVKCPTENPPGDTTAGAKLIEQRLADWGIEWKSAGPRKDAPNIYATVAGSGPGKHLVYNGHLDVFPIGDRSKWDHDPLSGTVVDGKLFGRGAGDMKGGLTASLWAFGALASMRRNWPGRVTFTAVSEEETFGPAGARYLVEQHGEDVLGDTLISGEPSSLKLMYGGSRGILWLKIRVRAEGGHSAKPHIGRSAVKEMLSLLTELEQRIEAVPATVPDDVRRVILAAQPIADKYGGEGATEYLQRITTNVGVLNGGLAVNMKAETCAAEFDIRFPPGVEVDELLAIVRQVVGRHHGADFEVTNQFAPSFGNPKAPIYAAIAEATEAVTGIAPGFTLSHAAGDHRLWNWAGVPAVVLGPKANNIASANEYITVEDLLAVTKVHAMAAAAFLTRKG
jgi:succinyl-diaminopimelate desuccinylase